MKNMKMLVHVIRREDEQKFNSLDDINFPVLKPEDNSSLHFVSWEEEEVYTESSLLLLLLLLVESK